MIGTIRFTLRVDKTRLTGDLKGLSPLEIIYSLSGQRKRFFANINLFEGNWAQDTQKAISISQSQAKALFGKNQLKHIPTSVKEAESINNKLAGIKSEIEEIEKSFKNVAISSGMVVDAYKGNNSKTLIKKEAPKTFVFDFIDQYVKDNEPTRVKGSLSVYKSLNNHLKAYQKKNNITVKFENMDYSFFQSFQNFLINRTTERGKTLNNITIAKQLSTLKTLLSYAKRAGVEVNQGYRDFVIKRQKLEVIALTEGEFTKLLNLDLVANKKLGRVRDVFCFSCMVGFRYSDIAQLRRTHIKGNRIELTVKKTKEKLTTPLNAIAYNILQKYSELARPLPVISNQRYNDYIKELCKLAEIDEPIEIIRFKGAERIVTTQPKYELISAHSARKTFASMLLAKGISAQVIMDLGGWSDFKSFQRYIRVNETTKEAAVYTAFGQPDFLKVVGGAE